MDWSCPGGTLAKIETLEETEDPPGSLEALPKAASISGPLNKASWESVPVPPQR